MATVGRLFTFMAAAFFTATTGAATPNWSPYAGLIEDHVQPGEKNGVRTHLVDYAAVADDPRYQQALKTLATFDTNQLADRSERLAFYINAYNILAIKMIVDHWPTDSIKDAGNFLFPVWKRDVGTINGETVTLHQIEHDILRKLDEPRIHFAIVCASLSCPSLRTTPFQAQDLDRQLKEATAQFLNNRTKGVRVAENAIEVTKLFDWFETDFDPVGGVESFIREYRPELPDRPIKATIPYDWAVNDTDRAR